MSLIQRLFTAEKTKTANGRGLSIAFLDTGVSPVADFILPENRIVAFRDLVNGKTEPYDDNGHGTHVTGTKTPLPNRNEKPFIRKSTKTKKTIPYRKPFIRKALPYSCSLLRKPTKIKRANPYYE